MYIQSIESVEIYNNDNEKDILERAEEILDCIGTLYKGKELMSLATGELMSGEEIMNACHVLKYFLKSGNYFQILKKI